MIDPRSSDWVTQPPMWDWVVGNLYHRLGAADAVDHLTGFWERPGESLLRSTGPGFLYSCGQTVWHWEDIPDLQKQDAVAKIAVGFVLGTSGRVQFTREQQESTN